MAKTIPLKYPSLLLIIVTVIVTGISRPAFAETPNVVVIFIDDMAYADIGPFGSDVPTPNLDRMAQEGRRFTNFIVPTAVCSASRAALMTGCIHRRVGLSGALGPRAPIGLDPDEETVAEICKKKNYATACFGKWHLGDHPEFWPLAQGFDEYFGLPYSNDMWPFHPERPDAFPPLNMVEGDKRLDEIITPELQRNLTTWYTDRAVKFIEKNKDKPFFLYVPHSMVHVPLFVSDKFEGKSGKGLFGDVVMEVDWSVGQILDTLRRLNLDKKTLVVFTSDNGPWLSYGDHAGSAAPLREGKGTSFEGGIREPTVFWWPGKIPAGTKCTELASTIDLLPTIAHLLDVPLPERKIDGKDVRPLIFGEKDAVSPHDAFPIYYNRILQAIRDSRWKLVFPHQYRSMDGQEPGKDGIPGKYVQKKTPLVLYDLQNDLGETTDVAEKHPEIVRRLQDAADAVRADLGNGNQMGPGVRPAARIQDRPNILWLTCEDIGRHLGCYKFPTAETPCLDRLARRGMRYRHAWSNYPVCAPARTTIITGCYPASLGAEQMRSQVPLPNSIKMYPHYLREAGYYCTNNNKEDYNVFDRHEKICWNGSNRNAHWKNRGKNQPFFAIFNFGITHELQIRNPHELKRDPEKAPVPKYHPNVPEIRRDWAQYHDRITQMDAQCGMRLDELEKAGLVDDTIVFFYGDHGSGMPRNKRTPMDCGLGVPMIVYFPPKFKHLAPAEYRENGVSDRLVSFVDLAPTLLSLVGIKPPKHMQGIPFAGKFSEKREYLYGFRGRMDERADLVRSVSDGRYVYVRNYHPEIIYGSRNDYMFQTRSTQVWRELYDAGKLPPEQAFFWELKPTEELYDLKTDPDEIANLADSPEHRAVRDRLKSALKKHLLEIRDVHFLPENMLHARFGNSSPWEMGHDPKQYPLEKILDAADRSTDRSISDGVLQQFLADEEPAVRYWAAIGVLMRLADTAGSDGTKPTAVTKTLLEKWKPEINRIFGDSEPAVRIVAAEILGRYGNEADAEKAANILIAEAKSDSPYTVWLALESLDRFAFRCGKFKPEIESLTDKSFEGRVKPIFGKIMESVQRQLANE